MGEHELRAGVELVRRRGDMVARVKLRALIAIALSISTHCSGGKVGAFELTMCCVMSLPPISRFVPGEQTLPVGRGPFPSSARNWNSKLEGNP
ncbi:MAG: hypothetical protein RJB43_1408 [Verrucomicrobiota bacterium]